MAQSPAPGRQRWADICKFKPDLIANSRQAKVYNKTLTKKTNKTKKSKAKTNNNNNKKTKSLCYINLYPYTVNKGITTYIIKCIQKVAYIHKRCL